MKFLILFATAVLFGTVQCDTECFRKVIKDCVRDAVPMEKMTLCDELFNEIQCFTRNAYKCDMPFKTSSDELEIAVTRICRTDAVKKWFDKEKECYKKSVNASECVGPINQAMSDPKTPEDFILANKKVCNLFKPYSTCVSETVEENCGRMNKHLFDWLFVPIQRLSNSLCEELILPADEKDTRPDNFGKLNVFGTVAAIFLNP
ncbi:uncharacterized protein LOC129989440 isoform X2 [Argiope bruennichi]|uniref:uncharacterized protein LOC129989440 isoform X2 n=1 Tax=Argiope bruennichi TaxID=94029 RepID=UPI0024941EAC|nr:uncharacterized protein LOC129989440 isoform X2 [Argiope bruennichi]